MTSVAVLLIVLFSSVAFAQQAPQAQATLSPEVQQLMNQMHAVGCQAEETAAAQTIVQLQKQIADLQKQLKDPPPKSGATKH